MPRSWSSENCGYGILGSRMAPAVSNNNCRLQLHVVLLYSNYHHDVYQKYKKEKLFTIFHI